MTPLPTIEVPSFLLKSNESLTGLPKADTVTAAVNYSRGSAVSSTLEERGKRYGSFAGHASITQTLKDDMRATAGWRKLTSSQAEALEMIAHKIGRILNGDPNYADSWHDIAGYASLVDNQLNGKEL